MDTTFGLISKWTTTYKKNGITLDWHERDEFIDAKHPHHMFLLQNFDERLQMDSAVKLAKLKFRAAKEPKSDHWKNLYHITPEEERCVGMSWMGWGNGRQVGPRGRKSANGKRKTKTNETDKPRGSNKCPSN